MIGEKKKKKDVSTFIPSRTPDYGFFKTLTSSEQQLANVYGHKEKSRFVYVQGASRCLKNTALSH